MPVSKRASNDEVERRGSAPTPTEADLSQSSIVSLGHRRRDHPRSLEPMVRKQHAEHTNLLTEEEEATAL
jgi:hypothetical protein